MDDEADLRLLYQQLLVCWNRRSAGDFAALFEEQGNVIGFDGTQMNGRAGIEQPLRQIFADHPTAAYVGIVKEVRLLRLDVAILRAVVGMVPPGKSDINPAVNAVQTLVAVKRDGRWRISVFQNTPAAFHGRPELGRDLTEELKEALQRSAV
jgi:uncharacterized protein (TIGR02246 family)